MSQPLKSETDLEGNTVVAPAPAKDVSGGASTAPVKSNDTGASDDKAVLIGKNGAKSETNGGDKEENQPTAGNGVVSKDAGESTDGKKESATNGKDGKSAEGENGKEDSDEETVKFPPFALIPRAVDSSVPGNLPGFPFVFDVVPARLLSPSTSLANTSAGPGSARPNTPFVLLPMAADPHVPGAVPELPYTWKPVPYNVLNTSQAKPQKGVKFAEPEKDGETDKPSKLKHP